MKTIDNMRTTEERLLFLLYPQPEGREEGVTVWAMFVFVAAAIILSWLVAGLKP